jgi:hypothetical protein
MLSLMWCIDNFCFFVIWPIFLWWKYCELYLCQTQVGKVLPTLFCDSCFEYLMYLIEESNQMDYNLVLLNFHDYFPSQMIWTYHWQYTTFCCCSMIAFTCGFVTGCWFGFDVIIVLHTHLLGLTFEFAPIVKDNKLRSRVTFQSGVMKQILDEGWWLICGFKNLIQPVVHWWIYDYECKKTVSFGWCRYCKWTYKTISDSVVLGGSFPYFLRLFSIFVIWHTWQVEHNRSTSCVRPGHVTIFLIVFLVLVRHGWSKYSWYHESTVCYHELAIYILFLFL